MGSCAIGILLDQECHKTIHSRTKGYLSFREFSDKDKELLKWRSEVQLVDTDKVCFHHEKIYLAFYERLQKSCCDPFKIHTKQQTSEYKLFL